MGTFGDIRARFESITKYGVFEDVDKKDMKGLVDYLKSIKTRPNKNTTFKIAGKTIPRPQIEKIIGKAGIEYKDDVQKDPSKLRGLDRASYVMDNQLSKIEDPEQKKNAEMVISSIKKISDPDIPMDQKVDLLDKLNDAGLIKKNAGGTKIYLDAGQTGLSRKILLPSNKNPADLQKVVDEYGVDNIDLEKSNRIRKKGMTGAQVFGDKKENLKVGVTENGVDFDGVKYEKTEIPSDEKLLKIYGSQEKVDTAKKYLEKQNTIIELAQKSFKENPDMEVLQAVPNTPPINLENRTKLKNATSDLISDKLKEQFGDKKKNPAQEKFLKDLDNLKNVKAGKEYDDELMRVTEEMFKDPYLETGSADTVEMVSYMRELNKGNAVYLPAKSNYPLGDLISISPAKIDFDKDSPEEINEKMQLIMTSVEARSIKKGAGGASSSGEKTELTKYKEIKDSKGKTVSPKEIKGDLGKLSNKEGLYKDIFDGDSGKAQSDITNLADKYGFDLKNEKYVASKTKSVQSAINNISRKNPDVDQDNLKKNLEAYYDLGNLYEETYNNTVKEQLFTNEQWKYNKTNGLQVNRTDGINTVAKLKFAFSIGWSKSGRPANTVPTRFVNSEA